MGQGPRMGVCRLPQTASSFLQIPQKPAKTRINTGDFALPSEVDRSKPWKVVSRKLCQGVPENARATSEAALSKWIGQSGHPVGYTRERRAGGQALGCRLGALDILSCGLRPHPSLIWTVAASQFFCPSNAAMRRLARRTRVRRRRC